MNSKLLRENTFGKDKYDYPKLEELVPKRDYALTLNIAPHYQKNSFYENYIFLMEMLGDLVSPFAKFKLRPEISTKSTLFHVHGTLNFLSYSKILQFYAFGIKRLKEFCTFVIKKIDNYDWYLYCIKQRHIIKPYLLETYKYKIPYKITHLNAPKNDKRI